MNSMVLAMLIYKVITVQQLEMLKYMRKFHLEDQSAILEKVNTGFNLSTGRFVSNLEKHCCLLVSGYYLNVK